MPDQPQPTTEQVAQAIVDAATSGDQAFTETVANSYTTEQLEAAQAYLTQGR
ncbi:hypothetical protein STTU_p0122 (plasmid) [Streptomyces sp. Tu6071]|uniref:hypothetical protein n=1 Tax=Streptomyces sp. Tu6071 TaxID=355249 RepID=UPI00020E6AED|nr:hypothetical protein [Streptomyces sp. Tu6071]EGJ72735.1 hypothetical protein STTU_p0122 [Streptomyces sp. Tu6071]